MFAIKPVIAAAIVLSSLSASAYAQGCRQLPRGEARQACREKNPNFVAREQRCRDEAAAMGLSDRNGHEHHAFRGVVKECMHRR